MVKSDFNLITMDQLQITPEHIQSKKVIGVHKGHKVIRITTTGGLSVVAIAGAVSEIAGAGAHPALAKYLAKKRFPDIEYNELEKSDVDPLYFQHLVPKYEAITNTLRASEPINNLLQAIPSLK